MGAAEYQIGQMMEMIRRSIPLEHLELPDEFFPAHLSVALMDAVARSGSMGDDRAVAAAERYCCRFNIARTTANRWNPPSPAGQETLADLIRRYDELGVDLMIHAVFGAGNASIGEHVLRAAIALHRIGIRVIQDVSTRSPEEVERVLRLSVGLGESATRMLLMYTGDDDFVRGDVHVRKFVADAIGQTRVSAEKAEDLVRRSAHELMVSPRYLDHEIWRFRLRLTQ